MAAAHTEWHGTNVEFLTHNTVRIEVIKTDGSNSVGTGFFYQFFSSDGTPVPALLLTNTFLKMLKELDYSLTQEVKITMLI